jgi:hypothetical protein
MRYWGLWPLFQESLIRRTQCFFRLLRNCNSSLAEAVRARSIFCLGCMDTVYNSGHRGPWKHYLSLL